MNCPECGAPAAVTGYDYEPSEYGGRKPVATGHEWCNTKGCKHHHQTGRPYQVKKGVNQ